MDVITDAPIYDYKRPSKPKSMNEDYSYFLNLFKKKNDPSKQLRKETKALQRSERKTSKIVIIGGIVVGLLIMGVIYYAIKKERK